MWCFPLDDDEPVQDREQPTGHTTRSETPPNPIQPPPLTNTPTRPFRGLGLDTVGEAWLHLEQLTAAVQHYNTNNKVMVPCNRIERHDWGKVLASVRGGTGHCGADEEAARTRRELRQDHP